jgi:hypothetical protein
MAFTSVVVNDFNVPRVTIGPAKTDPVLVVDPDAVLAKSVALQHFQSVAWRRLKETEAGSRMQLGQLAPDDGLDTHEAPHPIPFEECFSVSMCERNNHKLIAYRLSISDRHLYC